MLSPGEFIRHIDVLERADAYRPEVLFGTQFTLSDVDDQNINRIENLADCGCGEKPRSLIVAVRNLLASPRQNRVRILADSAGSVHALIGERDIEGPSPCVCLVRAARTIQTSTLAHFVASRLIQDHAISTARNLVVEDVNLPEEFAAAFIAAGFRNETSGKFSRLCCKAVVSSERADTIWNDISHDPAIRERDIWPAKISDQKDSVYLIPIKPYYAGNLFDHSLAGQTLFGGTNTNLILQNEAVYYSRSRITLNCPARILWYVSQGDGYHGTSSIRACSFLQESVRGPAKEIYKKFRRYGVFEWRDVLSLAQNEATGEITAVRFSQTECFPKSIPLAEILPDIGSAPVGPRPVSHELFLRLYQKAMNL